RCFWKWLCNFSCDLAKHPKHACKSINSNWGPENPGSNLQECQKVHYRMSATEILKSPIAPKSPGEFLMDGSRPFEEPLSPVQQQLLEGTAEQICKQQPLQYTQPYQKGKPKTQMEAHTMIVPPEKYTFDY
ncbi:hypothetical protein M9458_045842, partial [Cirrhinus mrigala]